MPGQYKCKGRVYMRGIIFLFALIAGLYVCSPVFAASPSGAVSGSEKKAILSVAKCYPPTCKVVKIRVIGKYAAVFTKCLKKDCESDTDYLKKVGNKWISVDSGTGITPDDLIGYGFPRRVAHDLCR
jgi:hypothetical protein